LIEEAIAVVEDRRRFSFQAPIVTVITSITVKHRYWIIFVKENVIAGEVWRYTQHIGAR
jgi:hypothetical protein